MNLQAASHILWAMLIHEEVEAFLRSGTVQQINFRCGPTRVWGAGYLRVADAIPRRASEGHYVRVQTNTLLAQVGCGNYAENAGANAGNIIWLPFAHMTRPAEYGIALHESTHALQDYVGHPMSQADSECAAYVAQAMYFRIAHGPAFPASLRGDPAEPLLEMCFGVASRIHTTPGGYEVSEVEQGMIKDLLVSLQAPGGSRPYRAANDTEVGYNHF